MPRPSYERFADEWRQVERMFVNAGYTRRAAQEEISRRYGVALRTVYRWCTEGYVERERRQQREYRRLHPEVSTDYSRRARSTPEGRERYRHYRRVYRQAMGAVDEEIRGVGSSPGDSAASPDLDALSSQIAARYGVTLGPATLARRMKEATE